MFKASEINGSERQPDPGLLPGERLDDLQLNGWKIVQKMAGFRFGTDTVLLADFAAPKRSDKVCDFGAGTGALCLLMAGHVEGCGFDALEIQPDMADMARRSVVLNGLSDRIRVHHADLRDAAKLLGHGKTSLIVCNPPYSPAGTAIASESDAKRIARHAHTVCVEDIALSASRLLKNGGRIALVYPSARALELMLALKSRGLEPKRARLVMDRPGATPKLMLLDAVKGAGSQIHWLAPLILRGEDGQWSDEWKRIYRVDRA